MKHILLLIGLLYFIQATAGDQFEKKERSTTFEVMFGLGTYNMKDLKALNAYTMRFLPFESKVVADFPPTLFLRTQYLFQGEKFAIGPSLSFYSTGSRISSADYSGEYYNDMTISAISPGIIEQIRITEIDKLKCNFQVNMGLIWSRLKIEESLEIENQEEQSGNEKLTGFNFYIEPGFTIEYALNKMALGFLLSYQLQALGPGFYVDKINQQVHNPGTGEPMKPNWSGVRLGLYCAF